MEVERQYEERQGFWRRTIGSLNPIGKCWFFIVLAVLAFGGFYIGFWVSCSAMDHPIDVPYVTADNYYADKEAAAAAMKTLTGDDDKLTIMLLGCDVRDNDSGRSDTLMLAFVDLETPTVDLLSIPRDTYVELASGNGRTKINHAFAYGGVPLTRRTVEDFLDVEIDRYVQVDFQGFAALIDALGGIEYEVEERMYRPSDGIDLQPGLQTLDGESALAYCRWREPTTADIGRVERQQKFMQAVMSEVMQMGTIFKLPAMIGVINDNIVTDMSTSEILSLIEIFKDASSLSMQTEMVPGTPEYINNVSYWVPSDSMTRELVDRLLMDGSDHDAAGATGTTGTTSGTSGTTGTTE